MSDTQFVNIFCHCTICLFILLNISFHVHKLFNLLEPHFFIFAFVALWFWWHYKKKKKKVIAKTNVNKVLTFIFFSRSLSVSSLIFKSLIHFELIFVSGIKIVTQFFCLWSNFVERLSLVFPTLPSWWHPWKGFKLQDQFL